MTFYQRQEVNVAIEVDDKTGEIRSYTPFDTVLYVSVDCTNWIKVEGEEITEDLKKSLNSTIDLANEMAKRLEDEGS